MPVWIVCLGCSTPPLTRVKGHLQQGSFFQVPAPQGGRRPGQSPVMDIYVTFEMLDGFSTLKK